MVDEFQLLNSFISIIEKNDFPEVEKYLESLGISSEKRNVIENSIYGVELLSGITRHKVALSGILTDTANIQALAEDRTRIVFLLAKMVQSSLTAIQHAFSLEFGPDFKIYSEYKVGIKTKSLKELAIRALEIRNGYRNFDLLYVRSTVAEIMEFYKMFELSDPVVLDQLINLSDELLALLIVGDIETTNIVSSPELKEKIIQFYKLTGRLDLDIQKLDDAPDYSDISRFVFMVKYVSIAKLWLVKNGYKVDDYSNARNVLLKYFAQKFAMSYRSDELARQHVKLRPIGGKSV